MINKDENNRIQYVYDIALGAAEHYKMHSLDGRYDNISVELMAEAIYNIIYRDIKEHVLNPIENALNEGSCTYE